MMHKVDVLASCSPRNHYEMTGKNCSSAAADAVPPSLISMHTQYLDSQVVWLSRQQPGLVSNLVALGNRSCNS